MDFKLPMKVDENPFNEVVVLVLHTHSAFVHLYFLGAHLTTEHS